MHTPVDLQQKYAFENIFKHLNISYINITQTKNKNITIKSNSL